ncbi:MAG: thrombospondin type 3 repeat-containing protein, partial [Spongiibacteraceae bacterium]
MDLKVWCKGVAVSTLSLVLLACSGGSSGGGAPAGSKTGQFVDAPITDIAYRVNNGVETFYTGPNGEFSYSHGDQLTFYIGSLVVGSAPGAPFITPLTLAQSAGISAADQQLFTVNLSRFLMTIDDDGDPSNGLVLARFALLEAEALQLDAQDFLAADFDSSPTASFARKISTELDGSGELVTPEVASAHLEQTRADLADGQFDNDGGVDSDSDGINDAVDACPDTAGTEALQGCADAATLSADDDGDQIANSTDNCPAIANSNQADLDDDGKGDACDNDQDGDGLEADAEAQQGTSDRDADADADGVNDKADQFPLDNSRSADSDRDGLVDGEDNCPLRPNTDQVDSDGDGAGDACDSNDNRDGDADGVQNFADQCPATASGQSVNAEGCSAEDLNDGEADDETVSDKDSDGVVDTADQCAATPAGESADAQGCGISQRDTDGDKVNDNLDKCPVTNASSEVDSDGCAAEQKDSDGDGVSDDLDACRNTVNGVATDDTGCSESQRDSDGDGVKDNVDAFPFDASEKSDSDGDGLGDNGDNCPLVANTDQANK